MALFPVCLFCCSLNLQENTLPYRPQLQLLWPGDRKTKIKSQSVYKNLEGTTTQATQALLLHLPTVTYWYCWDNLLVLVLLFFYSFFSSGFFLANEQVARFVAHHIVNSIHKKLRLHRARKNTETTTRQTSRRATATADGFLTWLPKVSLALTLLI